MITSTPANLTFEVKLTVGPQDILSLIRLRNILEDSRGVNMADLSVMDSLVGSVVAPVRPLIEYRPGD